MNLAVKGFIKAERVSMRLTCVAVSLVSTLVCVEASAPGLNVQAAAF